MTDERIISRHHPIYHQAVRVLITVKPLQRAVVHKFKKLVDFLSSSFGNPPISDTNCMQTEQPRKTVKLVDDKVNGIAFNENA
ncbi:unnamed protein product [Rhizopus microsporus]